MTSAAADSIRETIVGEVASLVLAEADRLGDSTLTAEKLAALFDEAPVSSDARILDHVLFGSTPMVAAAKQLRDRFRRMPAENYDYQTLLIISDGEPTDGDPRDTFGEIRTSGVNIVACFVTSDDIASPRVLHGSPLSNWTESARFMWDIASPIDESGPAARFLLSNGWAIERNAKLFVQVNHSDVLKEFARVAASHFARESSSMLPRGQ